MTKYNKTVTVQVEGLEEALKRISIYDNDSYEKVAGAVNDGRKEIARLARTRVPVKSGALKKSIRSSFNKNKIEGIAKSGARHAHLVEFGAASAIIRPKSAKVLHIKSKSEGFFSKTVKIPARKAKPFMIPSYEQTKPVIEGKIKQALREVKK